MDLKAILIQELKRRQSRNARYSKRAFANALGIHSSTLTRILKGSRQLTPQLAGRILKFLDLDPSFKSTLLLSLHESSSTHEKYENHFKVLPQSALDILDGWHHFAILSAFQIKGFQPSTRWFSEYFGMTPEEALKSLLQLERVNLIHKHKGRWQLTGVSTTSGSSRSEALAKIHREYIEKSLAALSGRKDENDFSGMTMAVSKKKLPEAIRRIRDFRRSLAEYLCSPEASELDEVYRLNIQLFSLRSR